MSTETWSTLAAVISAVVAIAAVIVAVVQGRGSRKAADESAEAAARSAAEAVRANELAEEANARADRAEARATARNDVRLRSRLSDGDDWVIDNDGQDTAYDTTAILGFPRQVVHAPVGDVSYTTGRPAVNLKVHLDAAEAAFDEERRHEEANNLVSYGHSQRSITFTERLTWRDEAGGWHTTDEVTRTAERRG